MARGAGGTRRQPGSLGSSLPRPSCPALTLAPCALNSRQCPHGPGRHHVSPPRPRLNRREETEAGGGRGGRESGAQARPGPATAATPTPPPGIGRPSWTRSAGAPGAAPARPAVVGAEGGGPRHSLALKPLPFPQ